MHYTDLWYGGKSSDSVTTSFWNLLMPLSFQNSGSTPLWLLAGSPCSSNNCGSELQRGSFISCFQETAFGKWQTSRQLAMFMLRTELDWENASNCQKLPQHTSYLGDQTEAGHSVNEFVTLLKYLFSYFHPPNFLWTVLLYQVLMECTQLNH